MRSSVMYALLPLVCLAAQVVAAADEAILGTRARRSMSVSSVCGVSLCQDMTDIKDSQTSIINDITSLSGDATTLRTDVNSHDTRIAQEEMETMYLKEGFLNLTTMVMNLTKDIQILQQGMETREAENMYLRADIRNLVEVLNNRTEENANLTAEVDNLKGRLSDLEMKFLALQPITTTTTTTPPVTVDVRLFNISMTEFNNPASSPVCFQIFNSLFDPDAATTLVLNDNEFTDFVIVNETVLCSSIQNLIPGSRRNTFTFTTTDGTGTPINFSGSFWAGVETLTVSLYTGDDEPFLTPSHVFANIDTDPDFPISAMTDGSSNTVTFENVPSGVMIIVNAETAEGFTTYLSGQAAATDSTVNVEMTGDTLPSNVDNNDFSADLDGWDTSRADNGEVEAIPHFENVGPDYPICGEFTGYSGDYEFELVPLRKRRVVNPISGDSGSGSDESGDSGSGSGSDDGILDLCALVEPDGGGYGVFYEEPFYYDGNFESGSYDGVPDRKQRSRKRRVERDEARSEELDRAIHDSLVAGGSSTRKARTINLDRDMLVSTVDEGPVSVTRAISVDPGVRSVAVRYRFVTSEVPGGYFGSEFNDYFSITLRNQNTGKTVTDTRSMNGLGLDAFDYYSGSTDWRQIEVEVTNSLDVIELTVLVANVADDLFDSHVIVDYMEEQSAFICIYSNVASDGHYPYYPGEYSGDGEMEQPLDDGETPIATSGHAGIVMYDGQEFSSFGLWPDDHPGIIAAGLNNGPDSDVRFNYAGDLSTNQYQYLTCSNLGSSSLAILEGIVYDPVWMFNCDTTSATFAATVYSHVTGVEIMAGDKVGHEYLESPRAVGASIRNVNGGGDWPVDASTTPAGISDFDAGDGDSSFVDGFLSMCMEDGSGLQ